MIKLQYGACPVPKLRTKKFSSAEKGGTKNLNGYIIGANLTEKPPHENEKDWIEFEIFRQNLERCVIEPNIVKGKLGSIIQIGIEPTALESTVFGKAMGVNELSNYRIRVFKKYYNTDFEKKFFKKAHIRPTYKNILANMSIAKGMVSNAKKLGSLETVKLTPRDLPWAINYFDYIKHRDGSHRRSIANYLNLVPYPSIVVNFEDIKEHHIPAPLKSRFDWFVNKVVEYRALVKEHRQLSYEPKLIPEGEI